MNKLNFITPSLAAMIVFTAWSGFGQGTISIPGSSNAVAESSVSPLERGGGKSALALESAPGSFKPGASAGSYFAGPVEEVSFTPRRVKKNRAGNPFLDSFSSFSGDSETVRENLGGTFFFNNPAPMSFPPVGLEINGSGLAFSSMTTAATPATSGGTLSSNPLDDAAAKASTKNEDKQDKIVGPTFANALLNTTTGVVPQLETPEPSTLALLGLGAVAACFAVRRKR